MNLNPGHSWSGRSPPSSKQQQGKSFGSRGSYEEPNSNLTNAKDEKQVKKFEPIFPELKSKSQDILLSGSSPNISSMSYSKGSKKSSTTPFFGESSQTFDLGKATIQQDIFSVLQETNSFPQTKTKTGIDLPSVPKTFIRKIKDNEFKPYLTEISGVFGEYQRLKQETPELLDSNYNLNLETQKEVKSLCIPVIQGLSDHFYDPEFSLDRAKTFHDVCSLVSSDELIESEIKLMTSPEIQDILAQNLDLVEAHLVQEIGARSSGFFSALSMLQNLEEETNQCVKNILELRASLENIRQRQINDSQSIIQLKRRRENMLALKEAIAILKSASGSESALQGLIENRDPLSAINLIDDLRKQLYLSSAPQSKSTTPISAEKPCFSKPNSKSRSRQGSLQFDLGNFDMKFNNSGLGGLNCLSSFNSFLEERRAHVMVLLESRFMDIFLGDLMNSSLSGNHLPTIIAELRSESEKYLNGTLDYPTDLAFDGTERSIIKPLLGALHSSQYLSKLLDMAIVSLSEGVYKIQMRILGFFFDDALSDKEADPPKSQKEWVKHPYGRQIKAATLEKFLDILSVSYQALVKMMSRTVAVHEYVVEFIKGEGSGWANLVDKAEEMRLETFEQVQGLASQLIGLRFESNSRLGTKDFYRLHKLVWTFVRHLELAAGRSASVLRSAFLSHSHSFFHNFHEEKMKHVGLNVDSDPWAASPVAPDYQLMAQMLQHAVAHGTNHAQLFYGSEIRQQLRVENAEQLTVSENNYYVSISGLALLQTLLDYLRCAVNLPTLAQEVANRMASLLDSFNQLVCQAVLGAGAMRTAGLNRISARHISVASQTLAMTQALIPALSSCLELCTGKILANQLQRVAQDLAEHQTQLHGKLVTILADRAAVHMGKMYKVDWDKTSQDGASQYMRDLIGDVQSLHRIMSRYLSPKEAQTIVTKVNREYAVALERVISALAIKTPRAKRHLLLDVQYLISGLSALSTQVANLHHLEVVVNDIAL